jgi:WD40 repeat protein
LTQLDVDLGNGILVSASGEAIHFSDIVTGRPRRTPLSIPGLQTFTLSRDTSVLAVASGEERTVFGTGTIDLYSYPDADRILSLRSHRGPISSLAFSPCRGWLAAGHRTGVVRVHDISHRQREKVLHGTSWGSVLDVGFNPVDGSLYASFGGAPSARDQDFYNTDNAIRCWSAPRWTLQWERHPRDRENRYTRFAVAHRGDQLAAVNSYFSTGDDVHFLSASSGDIVRTVSTAGSPECVCFSPSDDLLAIGCESNPWKAPSIELVPINTEDPAVVLHGHTSTVTGVVWVSGAGGPHSCSYDGTIREWSSDGQSGDNVTPHTTDVAHVAFAPDGHCCLSISDDDKLVLWSIPDCQVSDAYGERFNRLRGKIVFAPDSVHFTVCGGRSQVRGYIGSLQAGRISLTELPYHFSHPGCAVFSDDSSQLFIGQGDSPHGSVSAWDVAGSQVTWSSGCEGNVGRIALNARAGFLATCCPYRQEYFNDPAVTIRRVEDGEVVAVLVTRRLRPFHILFSPDLECFVVVHDDGTIQRWECGRWGKPDRAVRLGLKVRQARFTAGGTRLLCRCKGGVAIVDLESETWTGHRREFCDLDELVDAGSVGSRWATVACGPDTSVYDIRTEKLVGVFPRTRVAHSRHAPMWAVAEGKCLQFYRMVAAASVSG